MSATDELRRMLDERGVKHGGSDAVIYFEDRRGYKACAYDAPRRYGDGVLCVCHTATPEQAIEATLGETPTPPPPTPPKQPPYDELIESLRRDWDIEASWDGLRRFWYVGLTDEGVRKRDEREATLGQGTCEVEAENAKLRELVRHLRECTRHNVCAICEYADDACDFDFDMRELGIEVVE